MILDTSALLAIMLNEPEAATFASRIQDASEGVSMSVIDRSVEAVQHVIVDTFIAEFAISIEPWHPNKR